MKGRVGFQIQPDKAVICNAQKGDINALESLYHLYANACYSTAYRICQCQSMANDVTQEVFIKVMLKVKGFKGTGAFGGWLKQIVVSQSINHLRRQKRFINVEEFDAFADENASLQPAPLYDDTLLSHHWLDACKDINRLLEQLTPRARTVLVLHEIEGYTHKEIAQFFEQSESFSKVTLSRAYTKLKKLVKNEDKHAHNR